MAMLLTREEISFDFEGVKLDPVADKDAVEWIIAQFLYGEMTGIQCGHWLYQAPDLNAARFLAKQSLEEMQHVDNFLRMLSMMDMEPKPAHAMVRFLSSGMIGGSWVEHCCIEMASGEGFVLVAFYAFIDILDHTPSVDILKKAVVQEERHVEFGEQETMKAIAAKPGLKRQLLGVNLVSLWAVSRLAKFMKKRLPQDHPVFSRLPEFLAHTNHAAEIRLQRMGVIDKPLAEISFLKKAACITEAYGRKIPGALVGLVTWPFRLVGRLLPGMGKTRRLTDFYLQDPRVVDYRKLPTTRSHREMADESAA
jgi:bacterioferritin (cytochrome b1)